MILRVATLTTLLTLSVLAVQPAPAAAVTCPPSNGNVWFLGVVYDAEQRDDFILDIDNFEFYLAKLRTIYCIPDTQAKILAMENNFVRNGKTYTEGSEANVKSQIAAMGAAANAHPDSIFFFFLSSHGTFTTLGCPGVGSHTPGSLSALKGGGGQNGNLVDCELGIALNTAFQPHVRMVVAIDCSFCGGFSDSLTAVSGTVPDDQLPRSAGVVGPNRIVISGCAITTECFGSAFGGVSYRHLKRTIDLGMIYCDGFTAPGFPAVQGIDAPIKTTLLNVPNGQCTASEWFFGAVQSTVSTFDAIGIQQQFRIKYGFTSLAEDIRIF